jgi:hypothetical protein
LYLPRGRFEGVGDLAVVEGVALPTPGAEAKEMRRRDAEATTVFDADEVPEKVDLIHLPPHLERASDQLDHILPGLQQLPNRTGLDVAV